MRRHEGVAALVVLAGGPLLGSVLALLGGPWQLALFASLGGALAVWLLARRRLRDLFVAPRPNGPWLLIGAGAAVGGVASVAHLALRGAGWAEVDAGKVLAAAATAVLVGGLLTAAPEELTVRGMLFEPVRARFGGHVALVATALGFTAMHLPTWISSGLTASGYAFQVPEKVVFGLVAGWSVLRLGSLLFALGLHLGGNVVGVFLDSLSSATQWERLTAGTALGLAAQTAVTVAVVVLLARRRSAVPPARGPSVTAVSPRPGS